MSLQPGSDEPTNDNALTPQEGQPPEQPAAAPGQWDAPTGQWDAAPPPAPGQAFPPPPAAGQSFPPPPAPDHGSAPGYGTAPGQAPIYGAAPNYGTSAPPPGAYPGQQPWSGGTPGTSGYPPAGYPPVGYQAVGYPAPRQTDSKAIWGLVLALASWVLCPIVTAIAALVLASQSNRAIDASGGRLEGRTMNTATKWIAWLNIVLVGLAIIVGIGIVAWLASQDPSFWHDLGNGSTDF